MLSMRKVLGLTALLRLVQTLAIVDDRRGEKPVLSLSRLLTTSSQTVVITRGRLKSRFLSSAVAGAQTGLSTFIYASAAPSASDRATNVSLPVRPDPCPSDLSVSASQSPQRVHRGWSPGMRAEQLERELLGHPQQPFPSGAPPCTSPRGRSFSDLEPEAAARRCQPPPLPEGSTHFRGTAFSPDAFGSPVSLAALRCPYARMPRR